MTIARNSILLLGIQLALVSSIAAKYQLERWISPRAWTRAVAYDPEMVMRGRYLSMQLHVDACGVTEHSSTNPQNSPPVPAPIGPNGNVHETQRYMFAMLGAKNGRLAVLRYSGQDPGNQGQMLQIPIDAKACAEAVVQQPVDFYISESAKSPFPLTHGTELWVEVTVPDSGPPRPLSLALKTSNGQWQPLNYR